MNRFFALDRTFWLKESDQLIPSPISTLDPSKAVAYLRAPQGGQERWVYLCFRGRASKPVAHYSARSKETAEEAVRRFYEGEAQSQAAKAQRNQDRKEHLAKAKAEFVGLPGSVFVQSWGWEQTQVDAYQMVRRVGSDKIEAVKVGLETVGVTGPMSDSVQPVPVSQEEAETLPKILMKISGVNDVLVPKTEGYDWGRHAHLWDGKGSYHRSWYA